MAPRTALTADLHTSDGATMVTVRGKIDAATVERFISGLPRAALSNRPLAVDVRDVTFIGARACQELSSFNVSCSRTGRAWSLPMGEPMVRPAPLPPTQDRPRQKLDLL